MTPPLDATPCPRCAKRCHLMAGRNVPGGESHETYLVCWRDGIAQALRPGSTWQKIGRQRRAA